MPRRCFARLSLFVPLIAAALTLQSCAKPEPAPLPVSSADKPANAVALTFGRCDAEPNTCPRPADPEAAGDAKLQSALLKCFQAELGRPVYFLGDAPLPPGYWLDTSVKPKPADAQSGRTTIQFRLFHIPMSQLSGFQYTLPADVASYREICKQFSEHARPRLQ
jgi:hypothetical protein